MISLVSIIVPVYNVEKYIDRCVKSLIEQTYTNLEIILVNDGSTDRSGWKAEYWEQIDSRVKVINKSNGGLSDARNIGINNANGEFIIFLDSDDCIHVRMVDILVNQIKNSDKKIVCCDYRKVSSDAEIDIYNELDEISPKFLGFCEYILRSHGWEKTQLVVAWGKIYSRDLFQEIKYPKGKLREDEYTTYKLVALAGGVLCINLPLCYYFQRDDSIMGSANVNIKNMIDYAHAIDERHDFIEDKYPDIEMEDGIFCLHDLYIPYLECLISNDCNLPEFYDMYQKYYVKYFKYIRRCKLKISLIYHFPQFTALIYKTKRKIAQRKA